MTTPRPVKFVHMDRLDHLEAPALQSLFDHLNRKFFRRRILPYRIIYGRPAIREVAWATVIPTLGRSTLNRTHQLPT